MFLHKRKSTGYYYIHFKDDTGKQKSVSTKQRKKSDALLYLKNFKEREREKLRRVLNISLSDFTKEYLQYSKSIHTANSHTSAKSALNEFKSIVGDVPLAHIGIKDVENFIAIKRQKSVYTARRCFVTVAAAFSKALDWNYIRENPFTPKIKKTLKLPEVTPLFFSKDEFKILLSVIDNEHFKQFVIISVLTGLRLSELINLQWQHVDLINKQIKVVNTESFTTKSKKSRTVPLNPTGYEVLALRKEGAVLELVFTRKMNKLNRHYVSKKFKEYVRASGVNIKLHFHSLRHTCASWMVQAGESLYVVQQILGHSSINVTEKYSHLQPQQLSEAVNRIQLEVEVIKK